MAVPAKERGREADSRADSESKSDFRVRQVGSDSGESAPARPGRGTPRAGGRPGPLFLSGPIRVGAGPDSDSDGPGTAGTPTDRRGLACH